MHFTIFDWFRSLKAGRISISGSVDAILSGIAAGVALALFESASFRRPPALALFSFCVWGCF